MDGKEIEEYPEAVEDERIEKRFGAVKRKWKGKFRNNLGQGKKNGYTGADE